MFPLPPSSHLTDTLVPYTALFRSNSEPAGLSSPVRGIRRGRNRKSLMVVLCLRGGAGRQRIAGHTAAPPPIDRCHPQSNGGSAARSEEQTSELQSLMRTSNDAFCLKKKNNKSDEYTSHKNKN